MSVSAQIWTALPARFPPADRLTLACAGLHLIACMIVAELTDTWLLCATVGLPALVVPCVMVWRYPGSLLSHLTVATAYMIFTALVIQQAHGDNEAHFSFFVMTSFLVVYNDWRVLLWAFALIVAHHLAFSALGPLGLYVWNDHRGALGHIAVHAILAGIQTLVLCLLAAMLRQREALQRENVQLDMSLRRTSDQANRDALTGLFNRLYLENLVEYLSESRRSLDGTIILCMVDIDHFKQVNDRYGHVTGDAVLKEVADAIRSMAERDDCVIRYGGEEFLLVLRRYEGDEGGRYADSVRRRIAAKSMISAPVPISVSVSIGVAVWPEGEDFAASLHMADTALYAAKHRGRNRTELAWSPADDPEAVHPALAHPPATVGNNRAVSGIAPVFTGPSVSLS